MLELVTSIKILEEFPLEKFLVNDCEEKCESYDHKKTSDFGESFNQGVRLPDSSEQHGLKSERFSLELIARRVRWECVEKVLHLNMIYLQIINLPISRFVPKIKRS
jgi:hypothetical protein